MAVTIHRIESFALASTQETKDREGRGRERRKEPKKVETPASNGPIPPEAAGDAKDLPLASQNLDSDTVASLLSHASAAGKPPRATYSRRKTDGGKLNRKA